MSSFKTKPELVATINLRQRSQRIGFADLISSLEKISPLKSTIFYDPENDNDFVKEIGKPLIKLCQDRGCAAFLAQELDLVTKLQADGLHINDNITTLDKVLTQKTNFPLGYGPLKDKHQAMEIGEKGVDYLFFGKLGYDSCGKRFAKNLQLASWWAEIMQIPAILQADADLLSVEQALCSPVEFVSLESFFWQDRPNEQQALKEGIAFLESFFKT